MEVKQAQQKIIIHSGLLCPNDPDIFTTANIPQPTGLPLTELCLQAECKRHNWLCKTLALLDEGSMVPDSLHHH